jgi:hypothetical protein
MNRGTVIAPPFAVPWGVAWPVNVQGNDEFNWVEADGERRAFDTDDEAADCLWQIIEELGFAHRFVRGRALHPMGGTAPYIDPRSTEDQRWAEGYASFMDAASAEWEPLILALRDAGVDAHLWQTGGMCLAIGWMLSDDPEGPSAMLTGFDGPLAPKREHERPGEPDTRPAAVVGYYPTNDTTGEEPMHEIPAKLWDPAGDADLAAAAVAWVKSQHEKATADAC